MSGSSTPPARITANFHMWRAFVLAVVVILGPTCILFVDETENVIVERFGKITAIYDQTSQSGLHAKLPWPIDVVRRFDRRLQLLSPPGREAFTRDRKNITVDAFLCWRVADGSPGPASDRPVVKFFQSVGSNEIAESRLTTRLQSILTEQIGRIELSDLLTASTSEAPPLDGKMMLEKVSDAIRHEFEQRADEATSLKDRLGIEIVDLRIRRINLPTGNMQAVFERMRSERQKIAERYRSAGLAESRVIRSQADKQAGELLARAHADAERIRGEGEAASILILNQAHAKDPEFAELLQTLEAYKQILNDRTTLVLSGSNNVFKLLFSGTPKSTIQPPITPTAEPESPAKTSSIATPPPNEN